MDSTRRNLLKAGTSAAVGGGMTLEPGDIIATGTPSDVGIIRNTIRAEA